VKPFTKALVVPMALLAAIVPRPARADFFGGDLPLLTTLIAQSFEQVATLTETLATLRQSYDEAKRLASYAAEARDEFREVQALGAQVFSGDVAAALDSTFPDLAYLRGEAARGGEGWFHSNGELASTVRMCLASGQCAQVQAVQSFSRARAAIDNTYGAASLSDVRSRVADEQAAVALTAAQAQLGRNEVTRLAARNLMAKCTGGKDLSACQAAAAAAEIAQLEQTAALSDQVAQSNTLQAMELAARTAEEKQRLQAAHQREAVLKHAVDLVSGGAPTITTQGFNLAGE
jgi:hypothetical protein